MRSSSRILNTISLLAVATSIFGYSTITEEELIPSARLVNRTPASPIAGGTETEEYPEVIELINSGTCTATFVSPRVLITAAHCVSIGKWDKKPSNTLPRQAQKIIKTKSYGEHLSIVEFFSEINPAIDWKKFNTTLNDGLYSGVIDGFDLALIVLPQTFKMETRFLKISASSPKKGDPVVLLGYGANETVGNLGTHSERGSGVLRKGENEVETVSANNIFILGVYSSSDKMHGDNATMGGDSGGPLLNSRGEILGILSGWYRTGWSDRQRGVPSSEWIGKNDMLSLYQRIDLPQIREWIGRVIRNND